MFLANENFPAPSIAAIREAGYTVRSIREESPGIPDEAVIQAAIESGLVIITFDKDYGEIIFRHGLPSPPPVVFFRAKGVAPQWAAVRLLEIMDTGKLLTNCFTIVDEMTMRQRIYV